MSMTRDQLKVGEKYRDDEDKAIREVLFIGDTEVFYKYFFDDGDKGESSNGIDGFLKTHCAMPKPKKRYWLWDLKSSDGRIEKWYAYMDEQGFDTRGKKEVDRSVKLIKKHESEFIEVEVGE